MLLTALGLLQFGCELGDPWWAPVCQWQQMSWFERGIILVLTAMAIQTFAVTIDRSWRYFIARRQTRQFLRSGGALSPDARLEDVLAAAKKFPRSHVAPVIANGIEAFLAARQMPWAARAAELGWHAAERTRTLTYATLAVGCDSLSNIAAAAPYLGVTAAIVGVLRLFRGSVAAHGSNQGWVAAGLTVPLLMMVLGLLVTILATLVRNRLQCKLAALGLEMANASSELLTKFKAHSATALLTEIALVETGLSNESYREGPYDRQGMVLLPTWIFGSVVFWSLSTAVLGSVGRAFAHIDAPSYPRMEVHYAIPWGALEFWRHWGWLSRGIVIVLAVLLARTLYVMAERLIRFRVTQRATRSFVAESAAAKREFALEALAEIAKRYPKSYVAQITACAVEAFQRAIASPWREDAVEFGRRAGERCRREVMARMSIGLRSLASVAGAAAFIGTGGTLIGILDAFGHGSSEEKWTLFAATATGIAKSLIFTALGLLVAVVALLAFDYLRAVLERIQIESSNAMSELLTLFEHMHSSEGAPEKPVEAEMAASMLDVPYDRHEFVLTAIWGFGVFLICNLAWRAGWLPGWW
jgi:biopolymer transport protein ExbB/TolQ